ncbi:hypothetical protein [Achromobacter aloeverae]|uniref:hypothetical protein n=1 Tax=Achromobacter aloeverae TaxID=1750518 RepID=UPI00100EFB37|nr:hypothetical protein [Achromobacter aloeverae]
MAGNESANTAREKSGKEKGNKKAIREDGFQRQRLHAAWHFLARRQAGAPRTRTVARLAFD